MDKSLDPPPPVTRRENSPEPPSPSAVPTVERPAIWRPNDAKVIPGGRVRVPELPEPVGEGESKERIVSPE
jgi:hypothetical protein